MDAKALVVYGINAALVLAAFVLVFYGKVTWQGATLLVGALLTPSAGHVAMNRIADKLAPKDGK